jgi:hypothetical protein
MIVNPPSGDRVLITGRLLRRHHFPTNVGAQQGIANLPRALGIK